MIIGFNMAKNDKNVIVGLDIGTSSVKALVGVMNEDLEIDVLGIGKSKSLGMKRGVVIDISATVQSIEKAVEDAELLSEIKIKSVYVNISGKHIQSFNATGRAAISDHKEVSDQDLNAVKESATTIRLTNDQEILHVLAKDYTIDGQYGIKVPLGMSGIAIDGRYHLVTAAKNARDNIEKCIKRCEINPEGSVLEQYASSLSILTEDEKDLGVCLVDIGGGTTDIAIFSNGAIEFTSSVSLGGDHVTNDLAQVLKTSTHNAEAIKISHGCINNELLSDDIIEVPGVGDRPPRSAQRHTLHQVMSSRYYEIFNFINEIIEQSSFEEKIAAGIVLTGGGAKAEGLVDLAEEVFHRQVRIGSPQYISGGADIVKNPEYAVGVGLLLYAKKQKKSNFEPLNDDFLYTAKKLFRNFFYN
jgi:cell division protein FtsA